MGARRADRYRTITGAMTAAVLVAAGLGGAAAPAAADGPVPAQVAAARLPDAPHGRVDPDRLFVRVAPGADPAAVLADHGARLERTTGVRDWLLAATAPGAARPTATALAEDARVVEVDFNHRRAAAAIPNDPLWATQATALTTTRVERAWDRVTAPAGTGVKVAVLDTGIDFDHPDLVGRYVAGWDFVDDDANPQDTHGHGTMVAGIIAATTNNSIGVSGVAGGAQIVPLRVIDGGGLVDDLHVWEAVDFAIGRGAKVVNMSFASPDSGSFLEDAVLTAQESGAVVVAAAGNDGTDEANYPAAFPGVLGVGATDVNGTAAHYSNRGTWLQLAAPGAGLRTTALGAGASDTYTTTAAPDGTSFSAAFVSVVAARVRAKEPAFTAEQVAQRLRTTARDRGPAGLDAVYGFGVVDALAAVGGPAAAPQPTLLSDGNDTYNEAQPVTVPTSNGVPGLTTGAISPELDEDWYELGVTTDARWTITVTPPANGADGRGMRPMVEVYNRPGATPPRFRVASATAAAVGQPVTLTSVSLDAINGGATPYRIRVANLTSSASPGDYQLSVTRVSTGIDPVSGSVRPWIKYTTPENNATGVGAAIQPKIAFDRFVDGDFQFDDYYQIDLVDGRTGQVIAGANTGATLQWFYGQENGDLDATAEALLKPPAPLAPGPYQVRIRMLEDNYLDMLENWSLNFTVGSSYAADQTAPDTTITSGPPASTSSSVATFSFSSPNGGTAFECRLDNGKAQACSSPKSYAVAAGAHTFRVFARDAAGNEDASPATTVWTYSPPPASLPGAPGGLSVSRPASGQLRISWHAAASNGSTITSYTATANPGNRKVTVSGAGRSATFTGLTPGTSYSLSVRATNGVGTGPSSATVVGTASFPPYTYTARYTSEEIGLLQRAGRHFGMPASEIPEAGVSALAYITGISGSGPSPIVPPPANNAPNPVYTTWNASTVVFPQRVASYFAVNMDQAHWVGGAFMIYVTILQGG